MPRILRIINRFNIGGPTYNVAYLTKYLAPEFETLLVGGMKDETEGSSEYIVKSMGIEPVIIPEMQRSLNLWNDLIAYRKIRRLIRKFKPDIVHTHASKAGVLGRLAAWNTGVPVIVHTFHGHVFHSYFGRVRTGIYKQIERGLAKISSKIIAISELQKEELSVTHRICAADKITIIPLGFDLSKFLGNQETKRKQFRSKYFLNDEVIAIGIIGRLVPVKNHSLFLESISYLSRHSQKKVKAFIVGDGELKQSIAAKAMELGLSCAFKPDVSADIIFTSWIKEIDVVYAGLDIVALTSYNEGTPVSLIEAQAAMKPIVSTRTGGIENIVIPGKTALLSNINEKSVFFDNISMLASNDVLRNKMSSGGYPTLGEPLCLTPGSDQVEDKQTLGGNFVFEKYNYTRLVNDMRKIYFLLLESKNNQ